MGEVSGATVSAGSLGGACAASVVVASGVDDHASYMGESFAAKHLECALAPASAKSLDSNTRKAFEDLEARQARRMTGQRGNKVSLLKDDGWRW